MKIAVVATTWFPLSHADVIVTRWLRPYPGDAAQGWVPASRIVSVFLEQRTERDCGAAVCARYGVPLCDSIERALTLDSGTLAVDAVLLIGEHGEYPRNDAGQKLYPRRRFFDAIAAVFRSSGRSVPVFNDKHFSWDHADACAMRETARALGFPLFGGSSLPWCATDPAVPVCPGEPVREAVALFHGDPDAYGFHSIELLQSWIEHRAGGETGVRAVRATSGPEAARWAAEEVPADLLAGALRAHGYPEEPDIVSFVLARVEGAWLFQIEHRDGFRAHHLLLPKFASRWIAALRMGDGSIRSVRLCEDGGAPGFFPNFARLNAKVQEFFRTGRPPAPPERTFLATGTLQACLQAARSPGCWVDTPHLAAAYTSLHV